MRPESGHTFDVKPFVAQCTPVEPFNCPVYRILPTDGHTPAAASRGRISLGFGWQLKLVARLPNSRGIEA